MLTFTHPSKQACTCMSKCMRMQTVTRRVVQFHIIDGDALTTCAEECGGVVTVVAGPVIRGVVLHMCSWANRSKDNKHMQSCEPTTYELTAPCHTMLNSPTDAGTHTHMHSCKHEHACKCIPHIMRCIRQYTHQCAPEHIPNSQPSVPLHCVPCFRLPLRLRDPHLCAA